MAKLNEFISQVKTTGLSRTNRFSVYMNPPPSIAASGYTNKFTQSFSNLKQILLFCDSVQLPGINLSTIQNRTFGEFRDVPYEKIYGDLNLTFYVDTDMYVKNFFDAWVASIQHPITRTFAYYKSYITDMTVVVEDLQDEETYAVTLYECYPKTISAVQLDNASKDVMKLQVTMNFKNWIPSEIFRTAEATSKGVMSGGNINAGLPMEYINNFVEFQSDWGDEIDNAINDIFL